MVAKIGSIGLEVEIRELLAYVHRVQRVPRNRLNMTFMLTGH